MTSRHEATGSDLDQVLSHLGSFFMQESPIQRAARDIAAHLEALGIEYAIAGALSLAAHGVVRATEDVDVLLSRENLERFKAEWLGPGYVNLRPGGKAVRDTQNGVKIDFLIEGDFPGDGAPKPVCFPRPAEASLRSGTLRVLSLPKLIELKLASGMTAPHRLQDLADVLRLIEIKSLGRDMALELDPYVREKFDELWQSAQHEPDDY
jgi:hypothetical protein